MTARLEINFPKKKMKLKKSESNRFIELDFKELPNQPDPNKPTRFRVNFIEDEELDIFDILTSIDGGLEIIKITS
jgi:hypothetical protein